MMSNEVTIVSVERRYADYHAAVLVATRGPAYDLPPKCSKRFDWFIIAGRRFRTDNPNRPPEFAFMGREEMATITPLLLARVNMLASRNTELAEGFRLKQFPVAWGSDHPLAKQWETASIFARVDKGK